MSIRTDKISEIVNDSDSDGGSYSELSDSNMSKVNSPFSRSSNSNEEEEVLQPEHGRGRNRTHRATSKCTNTDFDLGWNEQIQMIQKPTFNGVPGIKKNFHITQDSSSWDVFEIFFSPEMFKTYTEGNKLICKSANKKKKQEGPLKPISVFAQ
jgi:hypothetical protein